MKTFPILLFWCCAAFQMACAATTAAWKLPGSSALVGKVDLEKLPRLESPPATSVFLHPGDDLRDLSRAIGQTDGNDDATSAKPWRGDWLVWNATSQRIVGSGSWNDLLAAEKAIGFGEMPRMLRTSFRLHTATGDQKLTAVLKSGEGAILSDSGTEIAISGDAWNGVAEIRVSAFWASATGGHSWRVETTAMTGYEEEQRIAKKTQAPDPWELFVTCRRELPDGTPFQEARLIEKEGRQTAWPEQAFDGRLKDGRSVSLSTFDPQMFGDLEEKPPLAQAPEELSDWIRGPVRNLKDFFASHFRDLDHFDPGSFIAVFDPFTGRLVVAGKPATLDAIATLQTGIGQSTYQIWVDTHEESGGWGLETESGIKARIYMAKGDAEVTAFEIDPMPAEDGLDLSLITGGWAGDRIAGRLETRAMLSGQGQEIRVGEISPKDGGEIPIRVKARWKTPEWIRR